MEAETALKTLKNKACFHIKSNLILDSGEKLLWFMVLERAIKDIGKYKVSRKDKKIIGIKRDIFGGDKFFVSKTYSGILKEICENVDTSPEYIVKTLKRYELVPFKREYYDKISEQLGL